MGLKLRDYPSWLKWLCAALCVLCGSFCSIAFKWQNLQTVTYESGGKTLPFEGALFQTLCMMVAESVCYLVYKIDTAMSESKKMAPLFAFAKSAKELEGDQNPLWQWAIPSFFDFVSTVMLNVATQLTYASTVQMMKNFIIVVTAVCQLIILRKAVVRHEWLGIFVITIAMCLTAIPAFMSPPSTQGVTTSTRGVVLGILLSIVGTSLQAVQSMLEELYYRKHRCAPLRAVGGQGLSGVLFCLVSWPIFAKIGMEDLSQSFYALAHSKMLMLITAIYIPVSAIFNSMGSATTLLGSGLLKSVCFSVRSPVVWIVSLIIKWQTYDHWSLGSAIVFCIGFAIYINQVGLEVGSEGHRWMSKPVPCFCTKPELDDDYELKNKLVEHATTPVVVIVAAAEESNSPDTALLTSENQTAVGVSIRVEPQ